MAPANPPLQVILSTWMWLKTRVNTALFEILEQKLAFSSLLYGYSGRKWCRGEKNVFKISAVISGFWISAAVLLVTLRALHEASGCRHFVHMSIRVNHKFIMRLILQWLFEEQARSRTSQSLPCCDFDLIQFSNLRMIWDNIKTWLNNSTL